SATERVLHLLSFMASCARYSESSVGIQPDLQVIGSARAKLCSVLADRSFSGKLPEKKFGRYTSASQFERSISSKACGVPSSTRRAIERRANSSQQPTACRSLARRPSRLVTALGVCSAFPAREGTRSAERKNVGRTRSPYPQSAWLVDRDCERSSLAAREL